MAKYGLTTSLEQSVSAALRAHELMEVGRIESPNEAGQSDEPPPASWTSINLKLYPRLPKLPLPRWSQQREADLPSALARRRSVRQFDERRAVTLESLGGLLDLALGASQSSQGFFRRPYPSAGARYPVETYLLAIRVENIPPGVYHYNGHDHYLTTLLEKDLSSEVVDVLDGGEISSPAFLIIFSSVFHRSCVKYAGRGYRYALLEAGAAAQTCDLACRTLDLGVVWVGGFPDGQVNNLLDVNWELELEAPVLMLAIGYEKSSASADLLSNSSGIAKGG